VRAPEFWQRNARRSRLLSPFAALWGGAARWRWNRAKPVKAKVPVICVGNLTVGGQGKTPVALSLVRMLTEEGAKPWFLTRGHGGRKVGPVVVDPAAHTALEIGDEPLLLARAAPTVVAKRRAAGAMLAMRGGASVIVMDDGLQNPSLVKSLAFVVIDGGVGFGNGRCMPAGPLREPVEVGLGRADAIVMLGEDETGILTELPTDVPVLIASIEPVNPPAALTQGPIFAFAGIGRPAKFFETIRKLGVNLVQTREFPDHYRYPRATIEEMLAEADQLGARLATTAKDAVRLPPDLAPRVIVLDIAVTWQDQAQLKDLLATVLRP
jgi:tetraacyldisaccharide 4'-kinase